MQISKITLVRAIVKLYFVGALTGSFTHILESAAKLGLTGWEQMATPFMIDGIAIIGMVMRSEEFSKATRRLGLQTQLIAGALSLAANVHAADTVGGYVFGVGIVTLFLASERLADKIESAEVDRKAEQAAKRSAAAKKAAATRKRKAQAKKREIKKLEEMIK